MEQVPQQVITFLEIMSVLFVSTIALFSFVVFVLFIIDITQTKSSIRRNYPVIGRFRYFFEQIGEFFRQYFFALDREEMPFNRAERSWAYRASKNVDSTVAFGSTRDLKKVGTVYFANCPFPALEEEHQHGKDLEIGPYCKKPYLAKSFFNISAMSYGSISKPAVKALSNGAKMAGIWLNTGEGGVSAHHLNGGCDIVFQIGTANYGVRDENGDICDKKLKEVAAQEEIKMIELKLSQGAKPGKGGILPGMKVTKEIAEIRGIAEGKDSISPNRHKNINSVSDLLDAINHIREVTGKPVGFKSVIGSYQWIEEICKEVNKRGVESAPDFITIDSADGGTGAAPMSLIDNMGIPIKESLPQVVNILKKYSLKDRIKIIASGKLINPSEVAWALCAGADFINSARGFMFALGCIQSMQCNKNTCPTGVATHNKRLQHGLDPENKAVRVMHYAQNMIKEVEIIAHSCGAGTPRQLRPVNARIVTRSGQSIGMDEIYPD